jgi:hypothetical protein
MGLPAILTQRSSPADRQAIAAGDEDGALRRGFDLRRGSYATIWWVREVSGWMERNDLRLADMLRQVKPKDLETRATGRARWDAPSSPRA